MLEEYPIYPRRHLAWIASLVIIAFVILIVGIQLTCRTPEDSEKLILENSGLREHDLFCLGLPRPNDFKLRFKTISGNSFTTAISYWYWTDETFEQLRAFYQDQLGTNGWEMTHFDDDERHRRSKFMRFSKDKYRISIQRGGNQTANYSLHCAKLEQ